MERIPIRASPEATIVPGLEAWPLGRYPTIPTDIDSTFKIGSHPRARADTLRCRRDATQYLYVLHIYNLTIVDRCISTARPSNIGAAIGLIYRDIIVAFAILLFFSQ